MVCEVLPTRGTKTFVLFQLSGHAGSFFSRPASPTSRRIPRTFSNKPALRRAPVPSGIAFLVNARRKASTEEARNDWPWRRDAPRLKIRHYRSTLRPAPPAAAIRSSGYALQHRARKPLLKRWLRCLIASLGRSIVTMFSTELIRSCTD